MHVMVQRLLAIPWLWRVSGVASVRVGARVVTLPIQSVDAEQVREFLPAHNRETTVDNVHSCLEDHEDHAWSSNTTTVLVHACCGLGVDICTKQGTVVWSADNSIHDLAGAQTALKEMRLTLPTLLGIVSAVQSLRPDAALLASVPEAPGDALPSPYVPASPWCPPQFTGRVETPLSVVYHYTSSYRLRGILHEGRITPSKTDPRARLERPVVWCSVNQIFEICATRAMGFLDEAGLPATASFAGLVAQNTNLCRVGLPPDSAPHGFTSITRQAAWRPTTTRHVREAARQLGGDLGEHRGSLKPVPLTDFLSVDVWDAHASLWRRVWRNHH